MTAYYNENDPNAAAWLRELIRAGHLPAGEVDTRSIRDVRGSDLVGFSECHFFAGVGGWPYALALAGWRGPVWTGSCPCQPFSAAGQRRGTADDRHLWPEFHRLIAECSPPVVFGEQVASKDGRVWLAGVRTDLESLAYAVGAADLCAAGVGAPHIRQRLYWVANTVPAGRAERRAVTGDRPAARSSSAIGLADAERDAAEPWRTAIQSAEGDGAARAGSCVEPRRRGDAGGLADAGSSTTRAIPKCPSAGQSKSCGSSGLGDADEPGSQGRREHAGEHAGQRSAWSSGVLLPCLDGKARRIEPGSFPLAHGVPARMGRLRGYGNAIVPQVAAEFVAAYMENRDA